MKFSNSKLFILCVLFFCASCGPGSGTSTSTLHLIAAQGTYAYDAKFLQQYTKKILELHDKDNQSKILLSADYQGRVMTTTATGDTGTSYGWINYDLISSGQKKPQFNPVGGEERFWMGPEGGQYALYFAKGDSFNIKYWQVPPIIDTVAYDVVEADDSHAVFSKTAMLTNYSGTTFNIDIQRSIHLLDRNAIAQKLNTTIPENIHCVGYESNNQIKNTGSEDWKKEKGLLSIWLLGMMTPTNETKVIIPFKPLPNADALITKNYFGDIPPERLQIKDSVLFLMCDGKSRGKIGLSPLIAKSVAASFDFNRNVLTLILFPVDKNGLYVNSKWELQKEPYKGDVVNAYNDGPLSDGTQLGPFYEIESSSSAKELKKGETEEYAQTTCHLQGDYESLRQLVKQLLGVDLNNLKK
jgi:hypothetical protein